jgi:protein tyrosine phosphatase (PTP) superfamily phosphohydrolase (DUF442 family)
MTTATIKTVLGFFVTLINKYIPLNFGKNTLEGIYNYLVINETITTSGQPSESQFSLIRDAGYTSVINLTPHNADNALKNEDELVKNLSLNYINIPVDFKNPTNDDFIKFVESMKNSSKEKTWVHCAANMRVSAFIYKYRHEVLNEDNDLAKQDLEKIWQPYGIWKDFLFK